MINWQDNTLNQPSKVWKRNCFEINDESRATYSTNSQMNLKLQ